MRITTSKIRIPGLACLFLLSVVSLYGAQGQGRHIMYVALATQVNQFCFMWGRRKSKGSAAIVERCIDQHIWC